MSDINRITKRGTSENLKASVSEMNKNLNRLAILVEAFKKADSPIPELERMHRHLSNAMAELAKIVEE